MSNMNISRCTLSAIASPDYEYIYVMGGFNGQPLDSVERYSVMRDEWEHVSPMQRQRFMHACCFASVAVDSLDSHRKEF